MPKAAMPNVALPFVSSLCHLPNHTQPPLASKNQSVKLAPKSSGYSRYWGTRVPPTDAMHLTLSAPHKPSSRDIDLVGHPGEPQPTGQIRYSNPAS